MRRKIPVAVLIAVFMFLVCSCGSSTGISTDTEFSTKEETKNIYTVSDYESVDLNNVITKDFCEITITKSVISHAANEEKTGLNLEEKEDNVWIIFLGTIKNTATSEIDFLSGLQAQVLVDNKYSYPVEIVPKDLRSIIPLKTVDFAIYAAVPEEVISSCDTYDFRFGFCDDFVLNTNSIDESTYKYQISGNIDEYGSAEQIQNFQTFVEYVNTFISNNGYSEKFKIKTKDESLTIENGNCLKFVSDNDVEISIYPYLKLNYFSYELGVYDYGILEVRIKADRGQENIHYISAKSITLKSSSGEINIGEGIKNTYDFNNVSATNVFHFDSGELSLEEVYSIIKGKDFEIVLNVETLENEDITLTYQCDTEIIDTLTDLLDIYRQMPNAIMGE